MSSKSVGIPNYFYDLIVFVSPSILIIIGFALGYFGWFYDKIKALMINIGAIDILVVILVLLFIAYEYGRLAEALSHALVTNSIKLLRKINIFSSPDYSIDFSSSVEQLELPVEIIESKKGNKWSIYFFALLHCPNIGQDLLKRYAWEKLSRSSAFSFLILFIISLVYQIIFLFTSRYMIVGDIGFGTWYYTLISFSFVLITYYEFYRRKCWNNDLLVKVLPILISASKLPHTGNSD